METTAEDARVLRTRAAVREALRSLFEEEGPAALTHQRVARRAEVGRATVYRHWPHQIDLVVEALAVVAQPLLRSGDGRLRPWLSGELARSAADMSLPVARQYIATVIADAGHNPAVADLLADLMGRVTTVLRDACEQAEAAGEIAHVDDYAELLAQVLGPLVFRVAIQRAPVDRTFTDRIVNAAFGPA